MNMMKPIIGYVSPKALASFGEFALTVEPAPITDGSVRVEVVPIPEGTEECSYEYALSKLEAVRQYPSNGAQFFRMLARALEKGPEDES